jgi:uncharacterized membrane protein YjjP (DUF1212 family)
MSQPRRFTFSLLRMLLSMAAIAAVLAIGRWMDTPLAPITVTAAAVGLLMFVIRRQQLLAIFFEGLCAALGVGIASFFAPAVRPPRTEYTDLTYAVAGAVVGWFVACCWLRAAARGESAPVRGLQPQGDDTEVHR